MPEVLLLLQALRQVNIAITIFSFSFYLFKYKNYSFCFYNSSSSPFFAFHSSITATSTIIPLYNHDFFFADSTLSTTTPVSAMFPLYPPLPLIYSLLLVLQLHVSLIRMLLLLTLLLLLMLLVFLYMFLLFQQLTTVVYDYHYYC